MHGRRRRWINAPATTLATAAKGSDWPSRTFTILCNDVMEAVRAAGCAAPAPVFYRTLGIGRGVLPYPKMWDGREAEAPQLAKWTWTRASGPSPAARMNAKRDHRVPLSGRALAILHDVQRLSDGTGVVFPKPRGKPLSDPTLSQLSKELGIAAVPHGFQSSFRDWAAEQTNTPREVVEAALAHTVQNPTEAAYARSDLFERRRGLMDEWAGHLALAPRFSGMSHRLRLSRFAD